MRPFRRVILDPEAAASEAAAYESALRLLAGREHSTSELTRKLEQRGYARPAIDAALARMEESGTLSDARFVASFIRQRVARGQGPVRIRGELRAQSIDVESIETVLTATEVDWFAVALRVCRQKFGSGAPRTAVERAKRARFLQYRGFDFEQIRAVLGADTDAQELADPPDTNSW